MNILLFMSAGNGDLINFTGPLEALKKEYPDTNIDFLVQKKHSYILEGNPNIRKIRHLEDYNLPRYCKDPGHSDQIKAFFAGEYDHIINGWAVEHFPKHKMNERHADFATLSLKTLEVSGFPLKTPRKECNARFYMSEQDHDVVDKLYEQTKAFVSGRPIALIETESFSWKSPSQPLVPETKKTLRDLGYAIAGNGTNFDINTTDLNLKQTKLFFDKYCKGFCGISSGMSCAIYAESTDYSTKRMAINGLWLSWNLSRVFQRPPEKYLFGQQAYNRSQLISVFGG